MNHSERMNEGEAFRPQTIDAVREGMAVVDANGERVGKVVAVKSGDPQAVTTQGNESDLTAASGARAPGILEGEPDVPEPIRSQLLRQGYVKIDTGGLGSADCYVSGDQVAGVSNETVRLSVPRAHLLGETQAV